jgi:hypothetical protein
MIHPSLAAADLIAYNGLIDSPKWFDLPPGIVAGNSLKAETGVRFP